jgi:hypothetical protein
VVPCADWLVLSPAAAVVEIARGEWSGSSLVAAVGGGSGGSCAYRVWRGGQDPHKNHLMGTPAARLATQGLGDGFPRMDSGQ